MTINLTRRSLVAGMMALPFARPGLALTDTDDPFGLSAAPRQGMILQGMAPAGTMVLWLDELRVDLAPDGAFIIAFDRDAAPESVLRADLYDDSHVTRTLNVLPGGWQIENVDAPLLGGAGTSEEFQRRRGEELARIAGARAIRTESDGWRQTFIWPVKARISGRFGAQRVYQGTPASYHGGVDIAGGAGTIYVSPADGEITLAATEPFTLEGNLLMMNHGMGLNSAFLHSSTLLVKEGERVERGQPLGRIGATGRASGPHLHWGMKWHDARIDPQMVLESA